MMRPLCENTHSTGAELAGALSTAHAQRVASVGHIIRWHRLQGGPKTAHGFYGDNFVYSQSFFSQFLANIHCRKFATG